MSTAPDQRFWGKGVAMGAALSLGLWAAPVGAVEGGLGAYLLGSRDSLAGIAPPPGTYITTDLIYMNGSVDNLAIGGIAVQDAKSRAYILKLNATRSFDTLLWGGQPVATLTLPVVSGKLTFASIPENGLSGVFTNEATGLGDLTLTTGLGWSSGNTHWQVAASVFAPTGYFEKADVAARSVEALSFGKNRWAIMPAIAHTYLNPGNGRELSASASLTVSAENQATSYQTAPEFQVEWAAMQHLPSGPARGPFRQQLAPQVRNRI